MSRGADVKRPGVKRPGGVTLLLREAGAGAWLPVMLTIGSGFCQALAVVEIGLGAQTLEAGPVPWAVGALFAGTLVLLVAISGAAQLTGQRLGPAAAAVHHHQDGAGRQVRSR